MIKFSSSATREHSSVNRARFGQACAHPLIDLIRFNNPFARQTGVLLRLIFKAYYLGNCPTKFHSICSADISMRRNSCAYNRRFQLVDAQKHLTRFKYAATKFSISSSLALSSDVTSCRLLRVSIVTVIATSRRASRSTRRFATPATNVVS